MTSSQSPETSLINGQLGTNEGSAFSTRHVRPCPYRGSCSRAKLLPVIRSRSDLLPLIMDTIRTGGEKTLDSNPPSTAPAGPPLIIFALDGAPPDQLMQAIRSGDAPNLAGLLGRETAQGLFEHGYAAPQAWSVLPSSTIAAWAAIFTGVPPSANGVTGDEWFDR